MIWLPTKQMWMNLDLIRYAMLTKNHIGQPVIYVTYGFGNSHDGPDQISVSSEQDINILNSALNARCADEAGEAFLP